MVHFLSFPDVLPLSSAVSPNTCILWCLITRLHFVVSSWAMSSVENWDQVYCVLSARLIVGVPGGSCKHQKKSSSFYLAEITWLSEEFHSVLVVRLLGFSSQRSWSDTLLSAFCPWLPWGLVDCSLLFHDGMSTWLGVRETSVQIPPPLHPGRTLASFLTFPSFSN